MSLCVIQFKDKEGDTIPFHATVAANHAEIQGNGIDGDMLDEALSQLLDALGDDIRESVNDVSIALTTATPAISI